MISSVWRLIYAKMSKIQMLPPGNLLPIVVQPSAKANESLNCCIHQRVNQHLTGLATKYINLTCSSKPGQLRCKHSVVALASGSNKTETRSWNRSFLKSSLLSVDWHVGGEEVLSILALLRNSMRFQSYVVFSNTFRLRSVMLHTSLIVCALSAQTLSNYNSSPLVCTHYLLLHKCKLSSDLPALLLTHLTLFLSVTIPVSASPHSSEEYQATLPSNFICLCLCLLQAVSISLCLKNCTSQVCVLT